MSEITNGKLLVVEGKLTKFLSQKNDPSFDWPMSKCLVAATAALEPYRKASDASDEVKAYEQGILSIQVKHCDKDEQGNPIVRDQREDGGNLIFAVKDRDSLQKEINEYNEEHADAMQAKKEHDERNIALLAETVSVGFCQMKGDLIPSGIMTGLEMALLGEVGILVD